MKGDYIEVSLKTGVGVDTKRVTAETDGSSVELTQGKPTEPFIEVEVSNKAGRVTRTALFAKVDVMAVVQGHETIARKAARKSK